MELATLQSAFTAGQTTVTLGSATFASGSQVVLMTNGATNVTYQIRTLANGPVQTVTGVQYFQLVDWKHRTSGGRPLPVIVTDGASLVPIMAAVYQDFNGQHLSLDQAAQEINAGRPVGIKRLTAQLIFLQGMIAGRNPDGTPQLIPYNQMSLMFSSANFTPEAANLG